MTVEPMTDAEVDRLRLTANAKWIDRGGMWMRPIDVLDLIARIDAAEAERDRHANAYIDLHGQHVTKMLELANAKSAIKRAEAERDAAVARAMPEAVYVDSEAVVENLDGFGNYMVARGSAWFLYERFEGWWFEVGDVGELPNSRMVGTWIVRLPDLPTPTAAQEATDAQ